MPYQHEFSSLTLSDMEALARAIAQQACPGDIIILKGEVGAGKTAFSRAFIKSLVKGTVEVTSPTFTLMQSYNVQLAGGNAQTLWHIDLYRLKHVAETEALGLQELMQNILLIEWPDIIEALLPKERLEINFDFVGDSETRTLRLHGHDTWQSRLKKLG